MTSHSDTWIVSGEYVENTLYLHVAVGEEANNTTQHTRVWYSTFNYSIALRSPLVTILSLLGSNYNYIYYVDIDITAQGLSTEA